MLRHWPLTSLLDGSVPAHGGRETLHLCDVSHFCFFLLVALAA